MTPYTEAAPLAKGTYAYTLEAVDAAGNVSAPSEALVVTIAEEIALYRGQPVFFMDADGSSVIVHLSDCGQAIGFMTLTNGETTGAAISLIYLKDTTGNSSLEIHSIDGSVPGTSFEGLVIDNAEGTTEALNMLLAPDASLAPGGFIVADGSIRSITLAAIGAGSLIYAEGINSLDVQGAVGGSTALTTIYAGAAGVGSVKVGGMTNTLFSGGVFGSVTVLGNVSDSLLLSGYDIGGDVILGTDDDGAFSAATGNIGTVTINGSLIGTTIIAGIDPGPDGIFGTADDGVVSSSTIQGAIKALIVKGSISGPTAVLANSTIGQVKVGNAKLTLPYVFGNILIAQNWR